jgi:hypothetical protein
MVVVVEGFHFCLNIDDHGNAYDVISVLKGHLLQLGAFSLGA